ncbi:accessory gene regulator B family protein [Clostridium sp. YIM B02505]|uniref:Accessory gene regulator B family protein n=1 Tax=Clostridium yunnanense TaxID=2800325 RepID=A0ABS1EWI3_9CLOT|nr:accessory gene regulator B family protein [Clostridium yunnanense]MBK1813741.1 accessory gene regulator B family protein [Clostridium yunnanense]
MDVAEKLSIACTQFIKNNIDIPDINLKKVEYGIQVIIINFIKLSLILIISFIFKVTNYIAVALISFGALRIFSCGLHADSNFKCNITNIILFFGNIYLSSTLNLVHISKVIIIILSLVLLVLYSPADTEDRPLLSKKLRRKLKLFSIISATILGLISIYYINNIYSSIIILSIFEAALLTTPIMYRIFKKQYNNYKNYSC